MCRGMVWGFSSNRMEKRSFGFLFYPLFWMWGDAMKNCIVHFCYNNMAIVHIIISLASKSLRVMGLLSTFTLQCPQQVYGFWQGTFLGLIRLADVLSHIQMERLNQFPPWSRMWTILVYLKMWRCWSPLDYKDGICISHKMKLLCSNLQSSGDR